MIVKNIQIAEVSQLSSRDKDYYIDSKKFSQFLQYDFSYEALKEAISNRKSFPVDRKTLFELVETQYCRITSSDLTKSNIESLKAENTFTITTAHQPSLLGGPLYYVYKILSAINLSQRLKEDYKNSNFVPIFVIGGEDHDYEEINHLHLFGNKITWESTDSGSVGKFSMEGIEDVLTQVEEILGDKSKIIDFISELKAFAKSSTNYGDFSFKFTHALFDRFGLVILRMDDAKLKRLFIPIIKQEIFESPSIDIINKTQYALDEMGYKAQTHIREINFFYRSKSLRNRIEKVNNDYKIVDTDISFTEAELNSEIENHPENFSPNVIMRPLFQSLILPDLVYIGGGGELAYWMERKTHFEFFKLHFPLLIRRRSALILSESTLKQSQKLGLSFDDLFQEEDDLIKRYLAKSDKHNFDLTQYKDQLEDLFKKLELEVSETDKNLTQTTQVEKVKAIKSIDYLESKLKKSIKQKEEVNLKRISKLKAKYFPSGLQERHDNILEYLSQYGTELLDKFLEHSDPFDKQFKIFIMQSQDR